MVSMRTGDADASKGTSDRAKNPFMMGDEWQIKTLAIGKILEEVDGEEGVIDRRTL